MSKLLDYLNYLDQNADAREAFAANPVAAMDSFGLSEEEKNSLISGDKSKVANLIGIDEADLPKLQSLETTH
ncbi:hypothetical protein [Undibacterium aquatile]|uniref:Extradiol ring-cleavage dioxygenase LigAB LigA subunit domain-containing protein n=1 Tax=Undibacterium aquatile TaxID=1537398 RepID=A0ABR6XGY7_9BURK|nr:hypothetical protein [Undibacterium aquatile]MBC3812018.1 hypothetical protein [Undibacterium aquatile]